MKRMIIAAMASVVVCMSACAEKTQLVKFNELPQKAQTFIETYFNAANISFVKMEKDGLHNDYDVRMTDGTEIDFDHDGSLEQVDCNTKAVPAGIVPEKITTYVAEHFAGAFIVKYEIDRRELKVELNNSLDLEFDKQGNFLRVED